MKFPHRIIVNFTEGGSKLKMIQKLNAFLNHETRGEYERYNIQKTVNGYSREFVGIELAFADHQDAVLFKLGFTNDDTI